MPATYEPIATNVLSVATKTINFTSISGAYTDLVIISSYTHTADDYAFFRVGNGSIDSGLNYSQTNLRGNGVSPVASRRANQNALLFADGDYSPGGGYTTNIWHIQNYANTTTYKSILTRDNTVTDYTYLQAGLWRSTSAIDIVSIISGGQFAIGSSFTLYGIKAA